MTQDETINQLVKQCALDADLAAEWKTRAEELSAQLHVANARVSELERELQRERDRRVEHRQMNQSLNEALNAANARADAAEFDARAWRATAGGEMKHRQASERESTALRLTELRPELGAGDWESMRTERDALRAVVVRVRALVGEEP